ncbi:MAG: hypothetical protein AAGD25_13090 [Cyanobacteria bacterium P01_F01_bin.150]
MTSQPLTGNFPIELQQLDNGQYSCQLGLAFENDTESGVQCYGQTADHALANALEHLAAHYRQRTENQQNLNCTDEARKGHFHVILHYERIAENETVWESSFNTIIGNTVVENAQISVIEIQPTLPINPLGQG